MPERANTSTFFHSLTTPLKRSAFSLDCAAVCSAGVRFVYNAQTHTRHSLYTRPKNAPKTQMMPACPTKLHGKGLHLGYVLV